MKVTDLPREILFIIFSYLSNTDIIFVRQAVKVFMELLNHQMQLRKIKAVKVFDARFSTENTDTFLNELNHLKEQNAFSNNEKASIVESICIEGWSRRDEVNINNIILLIKKLSELNSIEKKSFFKNQGLIQFCDKYLNYFQNYLVALGELNKKTELGLEGNHELCSAMNTGNFILYKHSKVLHKLAEDKKCDQKIMVLKQFAYYHYNQAIRYIPLIVDALYKGEIYTDLKDMLFVSRRGCFDNGPNVYHRWRFYRVVDELNYRSEYFNDYKLLGALHFKQLSELWAFREIVGDLFLEILAELKIQIMSDCRFNNECDEYVRTKPYKLLLDINKLFDHFQKFSDVSDGREIDISQYGFTKDDNEDSIASFFSW